MWNAAGIGSLLANLQQAWRRNRGSTGGQEQRWGVAATVGDRANRTCIIICKSRPISAVAKV